MSRAVDDKWVQTPRGVFPLKRFFGGGKKNEQTGEDVAYEVMKQKLLELIADEDKSSPLSDEELVDAAQRRRLPGRPADGDEVPQDAEDPVAAGSARTGRWRETVAVQRRFAEAFLAACRIASAKRR